MISTAAGRTRQSRTWTGKWRGSSSGFCEKANTKCPSSFDSVSLAQPAREKQNVGNQSASLVGIHRPSGRRLFVLAGAFKAHGQAAGWTTGTVRPGAAFGAKQRCSEFDERWRQQYYWRHDPGCYLGWDQLLRGLAHIPQQDG